MTDYQQRYVAYAKSNGKTPDEMLKHDKNNFPGGCMANYIIWINSKISDFKCLIGKNGYGLSREEHDQFNEWLMK
jgi:hypothetical protein